MPSSLAWYSASVDSTYLTGKRVFIFGDASHAVAAARISARGAGILGRRPGNLFPRVRARGARGGRRSYGVEPSSPTTISRSRKRDQLRSLQPELVLGTQMERHIAKRLGVFLRGDLRAGARAGLSRPAIRPKWASKGANVIFDTWVHPLMMGLEEHLLGMFREDFEFNDDVGRSVPSRPCIGDGIVARGRRTPTRGGRWARVPTQTMFTAYGRKRMRPSSSSRERN